MTCSPDPPNVRRHRPWIRALVAAAVLLSVPVVPGAARGAAQDAPVRILAPGPRDLPWGPTEVRLEVPPGVEVTVERLVGPGRWQRIEPGDDGRLVFDAGTDLGPETLRATSWRTDPDGRRKPAGRSVVTTAMFAAPSVEVRPDPAVDVLARPIGDARELSAGKMSCRWGGQPCTVRRVSRTRRAALLLSLLVDSSGSVCQRRNQLSASLDALLDALRDAPFEVRLRVVSFSDRRAVHRDPLLAAGPAGAAAALELQARDAAARIAEIPCGGATALWDAIYNELLDLELMREDLAARAEPVDAALVVFTDGMNTTGAVSIETLHGLLADARVPVFPVLYELDPRRSSSALLSLGAQSGGRAYPAGRRLADVLGDLGGLLSERWEVVFRPSARLLAARSPRRLVLSHPGFELSWPRLWQPPRDRLARARRVLRRPAGPAAARTAALAVIRREGDVRDARRVFAFFKSRLYARLSDRNLKVPAGAGLEQLEDRLGLVGDRAWEAWRSASFYAVFAPCARALAWRTGGPRERRRALALLEDVREFVRGERYSLEHVMGPVFRLLLDPDFPLDERDRARVLALSMHNPRRDSRRPRSQGVGDRAAAPDRGGRRRGPEEGLAWE